MLVLQAEPRVASARRLLTLLLEKCRTPTIERGGGAAAVAPSTPRHGILTLI
jgi:hypothetical protein